MKSRLQFAALLALLSTGGCAWYHITPVPRAEVDNNWAGDGKAGYIIYQPELYFAATINETTDADKKTSQSITVTPLYLPNTSKAYRVTTHNFLGKADFTFNFENGWKLTSIADKSDNTTIADTLAGQLQTILSTAKVFSAQSLDTNKVPKTPTKRVILYRPEWDPNGIITGFSNVCELPVN